MTLPDPILYDPPEITIIGGETVKVGGRKILKVSKYYVEVKGKIKIVECFEDEHKEHRFMIADRGYSSDNPLMYKAEIAGDESCAREFIKKIVDQHSKLYLNIIEKSIQDKKPSGSIKEEHMETCAIMTDGLASCTCSKTEYQGFYMLHAKWCPIYKNKKGNWTDCNCIKNRTLLHHKSCPEQNTSPNGCVCRKIGGYGCKVEKSNYCFTHAKWCTFRDIGNYSNGGISTKCNCSKDSLAIHHKDCVRHESPVDICKCRKITSGLVKADADAPSEHKIWCPCSGIGTEDQCTCKEIKMKAQRSITDSLNSLVSLSNGPLIKTTEEGHVVGYFLDAKQNAFNFRELLESVVKREQKLSKYVRSEIKRLDKMIASVTVTLIRNDKLKSETLEDLRNYSKGLQEERRALEDLMKVD